jgi:hypothetical protein
MGIARRLVTVTGEVEPFEYTIQVSAGQTYGLPAKAVSGIQPNISVNWGDGEPDSTITTETDAARFHTYSSSGTYTISIIGSLPGFRVDNDVYRLLYRSVTQWGDVGVRSINFYGCSNLTSIPNGAPGLGRVTLFNNTFRGTGLTSIPSDIFQFSTSALEFTDTFSFTSITSVPNNLFDNCTQAQIFNSTFNACLSLVSVPNELFRYNIQAINFSSTFRNNRALTNIPTFQYNTLVTSFANIFNMSSTTNGSSSWGIVEELWNRVPEPLGIDAFRNCTGITNYASIPVIWR